MPGALGGCSCLSESGFWYVSGREVHAADDILSSRVTQSLLCCLWDVKSTLETTALHGIEKASKFHTRSYGL